MPTGSMPFSSERALVPVLPERRAFQTGAIATWIRRSNTLALPGIPSPRLTRPSRSPFGVTTSIPSAGTDFLNLNKPEAIDFPSTGILSTQLASRSRGACGRTRCSGEGND
jgi:hypothetical protein